MTTHQFFTLAWSWNPSVLALCAATLGVGALSSRFKFSAKSLYMVASVAVLLLALASPINVLAGGYLFSAHMLQHLLLQLVAPPLFLLAIPASRGCGPGLTPPSPAPRWLEHRGISGIRHALEQPLLTWFLGLGAMWIWHLPALCGESVVNPWLHGVQTASLPLMGAAFWWPIIGPWSRRRLSPLAGVLYLFSACVCCTILGIILTFAPLGVCPVFMHPRDSLGILPLIQERWGLTPEKDQLLGGLLMWVPPCFVYMTGIFGLLARWYAGPDPELELPEAGFESLNVELE